MPLINGKSQKAFTSNLKTEMKHGKPQKQALAIAYSMKRKADRKKMADGGDMTANDPSPSPSPSPGPNLPGAGPVSDYFKKRRTVSFAEGGFIGSYQSPDYGDDQTGDGNVSIRDENLSGNMDHEGNDLRPSSMAMHEDDRSLGQHGQIEQGPQEGGQGFHGESYMGHQNDPYDEYQPTEPDMDMVGRIMKQRQQEFAKGGDVKGVHAPEEGGGSINKDYGSEISTAGGLTRAASDPMEPYGPEGRSRLREMAKKKHMGVIKESREMPNPKIKGLADGGDVVGIHDEPYRRQRLSEGGRVANDTEDHELKYETPNEFDDLVLRDDLESDYGDDNNAGDSNDNADQNHLRNDIVERILKSRNKKGNKLPSTEKLR